MNISPITNQKLTFVKRLKNMFSKYKLKLKTLTKDVFEKQNKKYTIIDGKKVRNRDLPNYAGVAEDYINAKWGEIKFYPEDEAIMSKIEDIQKRMEYGRKLIKEGKYTEIFK